MRQRTGDWRDLLSAYALALDGKKLSMGLLAAVGTALLMILASLVYTHLIGLGEVGDFIDPDVNPYAVGAFLSGTGLAAARYMLPLLNPFHAGIVHFLVSVVFYGALLALWSYFGGVITRLAALEYGRDDFPMLADGLRMVKRKWKAYWLAPLVPLIGVVVFALLNALGGLIGSIPVVGPILMIIGILPWFISTVLLAFLVVLGVLSFGLMLPTISIGGKDAFEGWSSAFSYVLWGFTRFVGYFVLAILVGAVSTVAVWGLCELFIFLLTQTINFGFVGGDGLVTYKAFGALGFTHSGSVLMQIASVLMLAAFLAVRAVPVAYAFAYFFAANTVVCFLLRKNVDRIEIDEVYEEPEEEEPAAEEAEQPEPPAEEEQPAEDSPETPEVAPEAETIIHEREKETPPQEAAEPPEQESDQEDSGEQEEES